MVVPWRRFKSTERQRRTRGALRPQLLGHARRRGRAIRRSGSPPR